ncbi:MAG: hypothetical protein CL927_18280 [Deltaproteobacteria bacterium]|nr:hypothetical protein [Deltaproteobacteria bacterium]HCH63776.1 hypothetical protein [Deltaproteobacteria bacterium]
MDSITQAVLGAAIAEAGFRKRLGARSLAFGAACGTVPDLDVVSAAVNPWLDLVAHRGPTHSLVVLPFVAVAAGFLGARVGRKGTPTQWAHLAFWALITHPLLDVFTSYGTQLLTPFRSTRFAFDAISIIDPVYTLPMVFALCTALRAGSVAWRIRTQRLTAAALIWGCVWIGVGLVNHSIAVGHTQRVLARAEFDPVQVRVMPLLFNHFAFRYVARDATGRLALGHASVSGSGATVPLMVQPATGPAVQAVLSHPMGQRYAWFADDMLGIRIESLDSGAERVHLDDLRYGAMTEPDRALWSAHFDVAADGTIIHLERDSRPSRPGDPSTEFAELAAILSGERW